LIAVNQFGQAELTKEAVLHVVGVPVANFVHSFFGDQILFTDLSQDAVEYFWDFGDGFISITGGDQFHDYAQAGEYQVSLRVENECGINEITKTINTDILLPQPIFFSNHDECVPTSLEINNESVGDITSYYWRLSGPETIESFGEIPTLDITLPGTYDLYIEFANQFGGISEFFEDYVTIQDVPVGGVELSTDGLSLNYSNTDLTSDEYFWDFGDNNNSNLKTGMHTFDESGTYNLVHRASNVCGESIFNETLTIENDRSGGEDVIESLTILGNPTNEYPIVKITGYVAEEFEVHVINNLGQLIQLSKLPGLNGTVTFAVGDQEVGSIVLNSFRFPYVGYREGIYHVWVKAGDHKQSASFFRY